MEDNLNTVEKIALGGVAGAAAAQLSASVWEDVKNFVKEHPAKASVDAMFGVAVLVADAELSKKR